MNDEKQDYQLKAILGFALVTIATLFWCISSFDILITTPKHETKSLFIACYVLSGVTIGSVFSLFTLILITDICRDLYKKYRYNKNIDIEFNEQILKKFENKL